MVYLVAYLWLIDAQDGAPAWWYVVFDGPRRAQLRGRSSWHLGARRTDCRTGHIRPPRCWSPAEPRRTARTECRRGRTRTRRYASRRTPQRTDRRRCPVERSFERSQPRSRRGDELDVPLGQPVDDVTSIRL